jgi:hypothetical protein
MAIWKSIVTLIYRDLPARCYTWCKDGVKRKQSQSALVIPLDFRREEIAIRDIGKIYSYSAKIPIKNQLDKWRRKENTDRHISPLGLMCLQGEEMKCLTYLDCLYFQFATQLAYDDSVNLIGHAAITEMIKLQFTTITDRIRNKIRNGNWFPKFSINRKEQKFLPICLRLLTLLTIIKDPSLRGLRGNQDRQKFYFWQPQAVKMFAGH